MSRRKNLRESGGWGKKFQGALLRLARDLNAAFR
jgi:hypothetical protein